MKRVSTLPAFPRTRRASRCGSQGYDRVFGRLGPHVLLGALLTLVFTASITSVGVANAQTTDQAVDSASAPEPRAAFDLLGELVEAGTRRRLSWNSVPALGSLGEAVPVLVVHGAQEGPTLCLSAAVHGDELNGIEIVRRVVYGLDADELAGTVVGVPIVNLTGFQRQSRYLPDRRDLNRYFPGSPDGSLASRLAYSLFTNIIQRCDRLADLHTGSFYRTNLPQLRADLTEEAVLEMTRGFGGIAVLHASGAKGTLRRSAVEYGIPAVTLEVGEPLRLQVEEVELGVKGIRSLMHRMGMVEQPRRWRDPQPVFFESHWVRAQRGGIFLSELKLGKAVRQDEVLGTVTDPITNVTREIKSPWTGQLLGKALNQVVMPGFAVFRIGVQQSEEELARDAAEAERADADEAAREAERRLERAGGSDADATPEEAGTKQTPEDE